MSTTNVTQAPPDVPTATRPPEPPNTEPRTERLDWLFVGYPRHAYFPNRNDPTALYVVDAAEVPRAIATLRKRDAASARYPYIFLAPALRGAFVDAVVATAQAADRTNELYARHWDRVVVDLTVGLYLCPAHPAPAGCPAGCDSDEQDRDNPSLLPNVPDDDPDRTALFDAVTAWASDAKRDLGPVYATLGDLFAQWDRHQVEARLHAAEQFPGGWTIILDDGGKYTESYQDVKALRTPGGARFVNQTDYAALAQRTVLPVAAARLVAWLREWHAERAPRDESYTYSDGAQDATCKAFPSDQTVARFLKEGGITDPAPNAVVARTAADLAADPAAMRAPVVVLPRLAWAGRVTLLAAREKQGKSTLAGAAVAALTRGAPWLGAATTAGSVLWLHEEAEGDTVARLQRFGADLGRVHLLRLPLADAARDLAANIARVRPTLVVIDSLFTFAGGRVTQSADAAQWWPILTPICDVAHAAGVAVLILHHAGKATGEYRDSTAIGGMVDQLVQMPRGLQGNRQTLEAIGRVTGVPPFTITVELGGDVHRLVGDDAVPAVGDLDEHKRTAFASLRRLVPSVDAPTVASGAWEKESGLSGTTFGRVREALIEAGLVERIGEKGTRGTRYRPRP